VSMEEPKANEEQIRDWIKNPNALEELKKKS
jgi:hypothetical protein